MKRSGPVELVRGASGECRKGLLLRTSEVAEQREHLRSSLPSGMGDIVVPPRPFSVDVWGWCVVGRAALMRSGTTGGMRMWNRAGWSGCPVVFGVVGGCPMSPRVDEEGAYMSAWDGERGHRFAQ